MHAEKSERTKFLHQCSRILHSPVLEPGGDVWLYAFGEQGTDRITHRSLISGQQIIDRQGVAGVEAGRLDRGISAVGSHGGTLSDPRARRDAPRLEPALSSVTP